MKFGTDIHALQKMNPNDFGSSYFSCRATIRLKFLFFILTTIGLIASTFGINLHVPVKINFNNFGDPLTFPLSSTGQNLN